MNATGRSALAHHPPVAAAAGQAVRRGRLARVPPDGSGPKRVRERVGAADSSLFPAVLRVAVHDSLGVAPVRFIGRA